MLAAAGACVLVTSLWLPWGSATERDQLLDLTCLLLARRSFKALTLEDLGVDKGSQPDTH